MRAAVLASGRGSNFDALERACRAGSPARLVLLASDRPDAAVLAKARSAGIPTHVFDPGTRRGPWTADAIAALLAAFEAHRVQVLCLAGFMRILPPEIVRAYPGRILNIHPSLLPAFPGTHSHRQALAAGVKLTGCTVHLVDEGVDTGDNLYQAKIAATAADSFQTYYYLQAGVGRSLVVQAVEDALSGALKPFKSTLPSQQFYHPTIWGYLWTALTKGVW